MVQMQMYCLTILGRNTFLAKKKGVITSKRLRDFVNWIKLRINYLIYIVNPHNRTQIFKLEYPILHQFTILRISKHLRSHYENII